MRITKKFAGSNGIGKQIFSPTLQSDQSLGVQKSLSKEIEELEKRFLKRIDYSLATQGPQFERRSFSIDFPTSNGYRIASPGENEECTSYTSLLEWHVNKKNAPAPTSSIHVIAEVPSPTVSMPALTPLFSESQRYIPPRSTEIAPMSFPKRVSSGQSLSKLEGGYVNEAYRVQGFEALKKDSRKEPKQRVEKFTAQNQQMFTSAPKDKTVINKKYHVAIKGGNGLPPALAAPTNTNRFSMPSMNRPFTNQSHSSSAPQGRAIPIDPSMDLHASALLLDFFRAARDKEAHESDSDDSSLKQEQDLGVFVDKNYHVLDTAAQDFKRLRTV
jgi:hypothetical protein